MLYFEHPVTCQHIDDECSSLGDASNSGYIMVRAFHIDGYINSNVKINDSCHEPNHHETVLTDNVYL